MTTATANATAVLRTGPGYEDTAPGRPEEATPPLPGRRIGDVILDVKNISLSFGGVKALTDISFDVREHEIRAIIGPNGAGKSSMLNCINGVYTPQKGGITLKGRRSAR